VLVGEGDRCWVKQWRSSSWCFSSRRTSALVGDGDCCCWMQWYSSSRCFFSRVGKHRCWLAKVIAAGEGSGARRAGASLREESIGVCWRW
jgi:hypothetical protein